MPNNLKLLKLIRLSIGPGRPSNELYFFKLRSAHRIIHTLSDTGIIKAPQKVKCLKNSILYHNMYCIFFKVTHLASLCFSCRFE